MRLSFTIPFVLSFAIPAAHAQDQQQVQLQTQIAVQQIQLANQQALDQQQIGQNAQLGLDCYYSCAPASAPRFSLRPGTYPASTTVTLKSRSRSAHIFYTTDGWTPTTQSTPYSGPITLSRNQVIQAVAFAPGYSRSPIAQARYTVSNPTAEIPQPMPVQLSADKTELPEKMSIPLIFTDKVDSETASIGDPVHLRLALDLVLNGAIFAKKGAPALASFLGI